MKKLLKWYGIIIGGVVALGGVLLMVAPIFVDAEKWKPAVEGAVEQATGRSFSMSGDLALSLSPWSFGE